LKNFLIILIAFNALLALLIDNSTWGAHDNFESKRTPKTLITFFDFTLQLFILIVIGATSFLWKRHSSVLALFTISPDFILINGLKNSYNNHTKQSNHNNKNYHNNHSTIVPLQQSLKPALAGLGSDWFWKCWFDTFREVSSKVLIKQEKACNLLDCLLINHVTFLFSRSEEVSTVDDLPAMLEDSTCPLFWINLFGCYMYFTQQNLFPYHDSFPNTSNLNLHSN
jgi:hypothetical protein